MEIIKFSPFGNTFGSASISKVMIMACVSHLVDTCSPAAIIGAISLVVVFTFYLQIFVIAFGHISNEIVNVMPPIAYYYTASAIIFIILFLWGVTPFHHAIPYTVKRMFRLAMFERFFKAEATTTLRFWPVNSAFFPKGVNTNKNRLTATSALAKSKIPLGSLFMGRQNGESAINISTGRDRRRPFNKIHTLPSLVNLVNIIKNATGEVKGFQIGGEACTQQ